MEGWEVSWWTRAPVRESRLAECSEGEICPLWEIMGASIRYPKHYATVSDLLSQGIAATPFPAGAAGAGSTQAQSEGLRSRWRDRGGHPLCGLEAVARGSGGAARDSGGRRSRKRYWSAGGVQVRGI